MADSSISATGRGLPTFMLDQEQLVAKAFDKLGLGSLPKESVHRNPLQAMECLARICIAIIGTLIAYFYILAFRILLI